jgi:hypothetical protein
MPTSTKIMSLLDQCETQWFPNRDRQTLPEHADGTNPRALLWLLLRCIASDV